MKSALFAFTAIALTLSAAPSAMAANAKTPYRNIDRKTDAGNPTGDSEIDKLNSAQLDQNYKGTYYPVRPGTVTPLAGGAPPMATPVPDMPAAPVAKRPTPRRHN